MSPNENDTSGVVQRTLTPDNTHLFPREFSTVPEIVRGDGVYVYDSDGNEYLDAIAGNQCSNIGHGVGRIADAAKEQIETLDYTSSMLFVNDKSQAFAKKMAELLPHGFEHTWMVSGGSEANESAFKIAREFHREHGREEKHIVIGRRLSYHGNTIGALSATGLPSRREPFVSMLHDWPKAPAAYPYRCPHCDSEATCRKSGRQCADQLEEVIRDVGPAYVSAFIAEPVVGAANAAAVPGNDYFKRIREICDEYNVLLIVDEVMSGMGRTGEPFAIEHWDVTPDIITCAKGMSAGYTPLGGAFPHERIVEAFAAKENGFTHGHTYCFNPTSSAIALEGLEYMDDNDVIANVREQGAYVQDRFEEFYEYDFVGDVRGRGLMCGVEFVGDRDTKEPLPEGGPEFRERLLKTGLEHRIVTYPGGGTVDGTNGDHVLITPPLTITKDQVDEMMNRLHKTFDAMQSWVEN